jgi:hypothetical protein
MHQKDYALDKSPMLHEKSTITYLASMMILPTWYTEDPGSFVDSQICAISMHRFICGQSTSIDIDCCHC